MFFVIYKLNPLMSICSDRLVEVLNKLPLNDGTEINIVKYFTHCTYICLFSLLDK